jgi:type III secretion protein W
MAISGIGPRLGGMRPPEDSLTEKLDRNAQSVDDDATPAAAVSKFVQSSDEMAASLRSQFGRRRDMDGKLDNLGDSFERVLEEDVIPKAMQILAITKQGGRSIEWLLQQARHQFPDPSDLALVLSELLRRREMPVATRQRLEAMLQAVLEQAPPKRLKAGINCALKARLFGKKLALKASMMRETYRAFLESDDDPVGCYEDWIALYGDYHRANVLDFIEEALLTDIDAQDPSCSHAEFGLLTTRLGELKRLRSADALFVLRMCHDSLVSRHNPSESDWLVFLLGLLRYPDELRQLLQSALGEALLLTAHRERGAVLHMLRLACLSLPHELFPDDTALQRVGEQFTELATITFENEAIDRHRAFHNRETF